MKKYFSQLENQSGVILLVGILVMSVMLLISTALLGYSRIQIKAAKQSKNKLMALHLAEAGLEKAAYEINLDLAFAGETDVTMSNGMYTTSITDIDVVNKKIISTGYVPNSTNPEAEVTVSMNVGVDVNTVAFNYAAQIGDGGLSMGNGSSVSGNVFSNGNISGGGTINGDAVVASTVPSTPDVQCTTASSEVTTGNPNRRDLAQSFTTTASGNVPKVSFNLMKTGSPGNASVRIVTNNAGNPSKTQVGGTGTLSSSSVTGSFGWVDVSFSTTPTLTAGTTYWLILDTSTTNSAYYRWKTDSNDSCIASYTGKSSASWTVAGTPVWTANSLDFDFKVFVGGTPTTLSGVTVNGDVTANTISGCTINGDANYQTRASCTVTGTSTVVSSDQSPQNLPISQGQINDWKASAIAGGTISGNYTVTGSVTMGLKKIEGDLTVNGTLYMTGPIWVEGNVVINNNASVYVDASMGDNGTLILASDDNNPSTVGTVTLNNNTTIAGNGNPGSYIMFLSTKTGSAITVGNNATAGIFYASVGTITVSNNAGGKQISGYGVTLNNNATLTYETGLQNATFANGPGGSWSLTKGTYVLEN